MSNLEAEELQREIRVQKDQNSILRGDIERLRSKVVHLESMIENLNANLSGVNESLLRSNALRDELERAREEVEQEFRALKEAVIHTIIKLPGGNEVTLEEARGMVRAHEKIES